MRNCTSILVLSLSSSLLQAEGTEFAEISENCLYEAQQYFSENHGWKYGGFTGLVTDGGGYGIYKNFTINVILPKRGEITYKQGKLSTSFNELQSLVIKISSHCAPAVNKSKHSDLGKLSPFLQKTQKIRHLTQTGV